MQLRRTRLLAAPVLAVALILASPAEGARISLIRDAEIENIIHTYAAPLFTAAGLDPAAVRIHLVNDRRLNAFVAGGMNLFLNTGLLLAAESPNQIKGVIAHETGHIAGGHLARTEEALRGASATAILAYVLGAAAIAAGAGEGGLAVIAGGQSVAEQSFLRYTRNQEQAADQFAVTALARTNESPAGLADFLEKLADQELLAASRQSPYLRTHPLTRDRIRFVRHEAETSRQSAEPEPAQVAMFRRMQAKLHGFLKPPAQTFRRYPEDDTGLAARYARAVAHFRRDDVEAALAETDALIAERPDDPYFHELRGQILFENGRVEESVASYRRAAELRADSPLLRVGLGQALIETGDRTLLPEAQTQLEAAVRHDRDNARAWRLLSIAYGRTDQPGLSALASAELAMLAGRYTDAVGFAKRATQHLAYGSPGQLRAEDIEHAAANALKKKENK